MTLKTHNCLVAQSGGPTAVVNASLAGIIRANQLSPLYAHVLGGIGGIEGVMRGDLCDLSNTTARDVQILAQTPGAAIGSCRYDFKHSYDEGVDKVFSVMEEHDASTLFYIGGNGSMDSVAFLDKCAKERGLPLQFIGVPKTVDNDLVITDHCPGFPSAARFANQVVQATWCDVNAYTRGEVFILETMGRDAGWLAGAASISDNVDFCLIPERAFVSDRFLEAVANGLAVKSSVYIVASEGIHYESGDYVAAETYESRGQTYTRLGGAGNVLKKMLLENEVAANVKVQDLSSSARSASFCQSAVDAREAFELGEAALMRSRDRDFSGRSMVLYRRDGDTYDAIFGDVDAALLANDVKQVPDSWIRRGFLGVTDEFRAYVEPLMIGETNLIMDGDVPAIFDRYMARRISKFGKMY